MRYIKTHLKSNSGSTYIETIISLTVFLVICAVVFTLASSLVNKLWLDDRMDNLVHYIEAGGTTESEAIRKTEAEILAKFGGVVTYECTYVGAGDPEAEALELVQLNDIVTIHVDCDRFTIVQIGNSGLFVPIHLTKSAVSGVYWKPSQDGALDAS